MFNATVHRWEPPLSKLHESDRAKVFQNYAACLFYQPHWTVVMLNHKYLLWRKLIQVSMCFALKRINETNIEVWIYYSDIPSCKLSCLEYNSWNTCSFHTLSKSDALCWPKCTCVGGICLLFPFLCVELGVLSKFVFGGMVCWGVGVGFLFVCFVC